MKKNTRLIYTPQSASVSDLIYIYQDQVGCCVYVS